jgi:dihydroorotate dehydrogenase electron transfer subunit
MSYCQSQSAEPTRGQFIATVAANVPLCQDHWRLILSVPAFPPTGPGQFVQLSCRDEPVDEISDRELDWPAHLEGRELAEPSATLRRPFSLAGRRDTGANVELELVYRVVGVGTTWLSRSKAGQSVSLIGPLGNRFSPPAGDSPAILVGGGVGIPPMLYMASTLTGRPTVAFCGAVNRDLLPLTVTADAPEPSHDCIDPLYNIAEFARHGIPAVISTDDGSYGYRGYITDALAGYLDRYFAATEIRPTIYTCGPEIMMQKVVSIATLRGIESQVSVERAMACGMGTCQSCCIRVRKPDPSQPPLAGQDWCWRLACTDGPVFRGAELMW